MHFFCGFVSAKTQIKGKERRMNFTKRSHCRLEKRAKQLTIQALARRKFKLVNRLEKINSTIQQIDKAIEKYNEEQKKKGA